MALAGRFVKGCAILRELAADKGRLLVDGLIDQRAARPYNHVLSVQYRYRYLGTGTRYQVLVVCTSINFNNN